MTFTLLMSKLRSNKVYLMNILYMLDINCILQFICRIGYPIYNNYIRNLITVCDWQYFKSFFARVVKCIYLIQNTLNVGCIVGFNNIRNVFLGRFPYFLRLTSPTCKNHKSLNFNLRVSFIAKSKRFQTYCYKQFNRHRFLNVYCLKL